MKKVFLRITQNSQEIPCTGVFFDKVGVLQSATLLKGRCRYRYFPVNFAKFSSTSILQNTSRRLLGFSLFQKRFLIMNYF